MINNTRRGKVNREGEISHLIESIDTQSLTCASRLLLSVFLVNEGESKGRHVVIDSSHNVIMLSLTLVTIPIS